MYTVGLFYKPTCGYCRKVLNYLEQNNITIPLKNVSEKPEVREELLKITGKTQVPCLMINGAPLLESDDIIKWFRENWSQQ